MQAATDRDIQEIASPNSECLGLWGGANMSVKGWTSVNFFATHKLVQISQKGSVELSPLADIFW